MHAIEKTKADWKNNTLPNVKNALNFDKSITLEV